MIKKHIQKGVYIYLVLPGILMFFIALIMGLVLSSLFMFIITVITYFLFDTVVIKQYIYSYLSKYSITDLEEYFRGYFQYSYDKYMIFKKVKIECDLRQKLIIKKYMRISNNAFYKELKYHPQNYLDPFLTFASRYSIFINIVDSDEYSIELKSQKNMLNYNVLVIDKTKLNASILPIDKNIDALCYDFVFYIESDGTIKIHRNFMRKSLYNTDFIHNKKKQAKYFGEKYLLISNFQYVNYIVNDLFI